MFCIQIQNVIWCGFVHFVSSSPHFCLWCSCLPRAKGISDRLFPRRQLSHELLVWIVTVSFLVAAGLEQSGRKGAPCCLTPGLSLVWALLIRLGWLADPQGSTHVSLPTPAGITQLTYVDSGVGIQVPILAYYVLYYLPSSTLLLLLLRQGLTKFPQAGPELTLYPRWVLNMCSFYLRFLDCWDCRPVPPICLVVSGS